jgi:acyl-coenzyme A thioesterase PaaI-like protein
MQLDYFEPVVGPEFEIESQIVKRRGRTHFVETRFLEAGDVLAVLAMTTLREVPLDRALGDV